MVLRWPVRPHAGREGEARRLLILLFGEGLSSNMLRPVVPLVAIGLGAGPAIAGTLLATQELTSAFVRIPAAVTAVTIGRRALLLGCFAGGVAACALFGLAPAVGWLFLAQVLWGASTASFWPVQWAYLTDLMPQGQYARALGFGMGISGTGLLLGPIIAGGAADLWGLRAPFVAVGLWMAVAVGVVWALPRGSPGTGEVLKELGRSMATAGRLLRSLPVLAASAGSFITQAADGASTVFIPLHLHAAGYPVVFIGSAVTARKLMTVATRFLFSSLSHRLGLTGLFAVGLVLDLAGLAGLVLLKDWWALLGAAMLSGLGGGAGEPAAKTMVVQRTDGRERDLGLGVEGTALVLGRAAGAAGLGILAGATGVVGATVVICGVLGAMGVGIVWWWLQLHRVPSAPAAG